MDQKLGNIQAGINEIKVDISRLISMAKEEKVRDYKKVIDEFETLIIDYNNVLTDVVTIQQRAAFDMALEDAVERGDLEELPVFYGMTAAEAASKKEELRQQFLPKVEDMTDREAAEYNVRVMTYLNQKAQDINNSDYVSYQRKFEKLEELFGRISGMLSKPKASNPITFYDDLCALTYNFDSQTYDFRLSTRVALEYQLTKAMWAFAFHYKISYNNSSLYNNRATEYGNALKALQSMVVSGHPASEIKAGPHYEFTSYMPEKVTYIGDIMVAGSTDPYVCWKELQNSGYTVINKDLNEDAGGLWVYLGYKTTTNYNDAIKSLMVFSSNSIEYGDKILGYNLCPFTGGSSFLRTRGDLNEGAGGPYLYLCYSKKESDGKPITSIEFVNYVPDYTHQIEGTQRDLNQGAGGSDIYFYLNRTNSKNDGNPVTVPTGRFVDTDPEYHPYCYALGCKVAAYIPGNSDNINISSSEHASIIKDRLSKNFRTWTDSETEEFISRMHYSTLSEELISAGFDLSHSSTGDDISKKLKYNFRIIYKYQVKKIILTYLIRGL